MMTETDAATVHEKGRAVLLTAMMVLSVVAMSAAFVGGATAAQNARYHDDQTVYPGDVVYQGEDDFEFSDDFTRDTLNGVENGGAEGEQLAPPVPETQLTGTYGDGDGNTVIVTTPRVTGLTINNVYDDGSVNAVDGSSISTEDADTMSVAVEYSFDDAEYIDISVEDESGTDVTDQVTDDNTIEKTGDSIGLDLSTEDAGEYTVTAQGAGNLDSGDAVETAPVELRTDADLGLEVDTDSAVRGDNVGYTVSGGSDGDTHLVVIERSEFRDGITADNAESIFRNVDDTEAVGVYPESDDTENIDFAWAEVGIGGTTAVGQIETQYLDDGSVDVDVYDTGVDAADVDAGADSIDDVSLDVSGGDITIENPENSYVIGSEIDINGTADGSDEVAVFVRDNADWRLVEQGIAVDSDGTFEEEDYVLSRDGGAGSDSLSLPGTYRFGVIDQSDADEVMADDNTISTSDFNQGTSTTSSLRVVEGELTVDHVSIIDGQVADGETLSIRGTAPGQDSVYVSFYGPHGTYDRRPISTDSEYVFETEDIQVGNNLGPEIGTDTSINQGTVYMSVYSKGRDNVPGDGSVESVDGGTVEQQFVSMYTQLNTGSTSQQQVMERIASETTRDSGSDDISRLFQFQYTDPQTTIENVSSASAGEGTVVAGEAMTVTGVTNRQPDDNTISVEVTDGPSATQFDLALTEQWGADGRWNVTLDTEGIDPGTYTIETNDGDSTDRADIRITEEPEDVADGGSDDENSDDDHSDDTADESSDDTADESSDGMSDDNGDDTADDTSDKASNEISDDGMPGFGITVTIGALLAAVLALRRDDRHH
ncbi:HVO_2072 family ArtA-dependent S-layer glycoprotein [Natrinema pallidum]|uniref:Cell surface glycoprotein n=1 Tax=Natrinema pallidum TaxID=69527 RepID=A0A4V1IFF6_9EURY|nr:HVO_2072 family ArtA-dependent S-layer glycoprotein [Natrinema pallidum]QCW04824.1 major cell surface glycoprotein [Natrinema pallidum]